MNHSECCNFLKPPFLIRSNISLFLTSSSSSDEKLEYSFLLLTLCSFYSWWALRSNLPTDFVEDWAAAKFCSTYVFDSLRRSTFCLRLASSLYFLEGFPLFFRSSASSFVSWAGLSCFFFLWRVSLLTNSFIVDIL